MCIGTPVLIERCTGFTAEGTARGVPVRIGLALVGPQQPGTWVLVHVDQAVRVLDPAEARSIGDALDGLEAAMAGDGFEHLFADLIGREPQLPEHLRPPAEVRAAEFTAGDAQ